MSFDGACWGFVECLAGIRSQVLSLWKIYIKKHYFCQLFRHPSSFFTMYMPKFLFYRVHAECFMSSIATKYSSLKLYAHGMRPVRLISWRHVLFWRVWYGLRSSRSESEHWVWCVNVETGSTRTQTINAQDACRVHPALVAVMRFRNKQCLCSLKKEWANGRWKKKQPRFSGQNFDETEQTLQELRTSVSYWIVLHCFVTVSRSLRRLALSAWVTITVLYLYSI